MLTADDRTGRRSAHGVINLVVLVTGGTGFLGRRVVHELLERGHQVRCLVHTPGRERMFSHRAVEVQYGSVRDPASLSNAFYDVEAVVHLVGIIRRRRRDSFEDVHREGTANVLAAAKEAGARHFLHVSVIGAANDRSYPYLYTKWLGEQEVIKAGIPYTIFRPSVLFGEGDEFLNVLAGLVRLFPLVPVIGSGKNRYHPLAADDLARCIVITLGREDLKGRTLDLGGSKRMNYNDLVSEVARAMGKRRLRFHLPVWLMYAIAALSQGFMPRPPITTDQLKMLEIRSVAELGELEKVFGFTPRPMAGNIDFVNSVGVADGIQMLLGSMPRRVRDH
ncbi:MAG: complex I NDUFA9 subunit family protein [Chloroflexi bacterium]|nr:complex I NDUFA9 subunit family protein [Chloroflexota bacterium]MCI0829668.1 complex I NDUFA9 subunit family protein [Chloroflexota bacterium]MCI0848262.1 complex I NDUFA9 subunit family protein [Chloroflexota bacterium]MCI0863789.1 complex I NDUFA9 subunit family protein [Chloroflexota bacterium]MCI0898285.1 complex I NDUFA9 subunit family protein [Chloroflexota bacterium]